MRKKLLILLMISVSATAMEVVGVPGIYKEIPAKYLPQALWEKGYWEASIDSVANNKMFITLGRPSKINSFKINLPDSVAKHLRNIDPPSKGSLVDAQRIKIFLDDVVHRLENSGYPFAACSVSTDIAENNEKEILLDISFELETGPYIELIYLDSQIDGKTKGSVIEHLMLFKPNKPFRKKYIQSGSRRLRRSRIIRLRGEPYPAIDSEGNYVLVVRGKDLIVNSFQGIIGTDGEKILGDLQFASKNLFGTGRKFSIKLFLENERTTFELDYIEPFLGKSNISPQFRMKFQNADFVRQNYRFGVQFPISFELDGYTGFSILRNYPSETPNEGTRSLTLEFWGSYTSVEDVLMPRSGFTMRLGGEVSRINDYKEDEIQPAANANFSVFAALPIKTLSIWLKATGTGYIEPKLPDFSLWFPLGGWTNLRGYRQEQFYGAKIGVLTIEPRLFFQNNASVLGFLDIGAFYNVDGWQVKPGYGVGFEFARPPGAMSIIYGLGEDRKISKGLIHIGLRLDI